MDIVFVNNANSLEGLSIKNYNSNPGIGGTQYVTLKIIFGLLENSKKLNISLATDQKVFSNDIKIITKGKQVKNAIIVSPVSQINYLKTLNTENCRIILWSHHPHESIYGNEDNFKEILSLGEYQYYSNKNISLKRFLIPNPFPKPIPKKDLPRLNSTYPKNFVFIGAFGPAKGLHLVLKNWPKIRKSFKNSNLRIIGGNLYKEGKNTGKFSHGFLRSYEKVIESILDKMSKSDRESVNFLGLISESEKDKVLKESDIALLNPTGKSEAAPASPLECYCYGIPVIAGGDFGAFDNMKDFPELDLKLNKLNEIINFLKDNHNYKLIKDRTYKISIENFKKNKSIFINWIKLFNNKLDEPNINLPRSIIIKIKLRDFYYRLIKYPIKRIKGDFKYLKA